MFYLTRRFNAINCKAGKCGLSGLRVWVCEIKPTNAFLQSDIKRRQVLDRGILYKANFVELNRRGGLLALEGQRLV